MTLAPKTVLGVALFAAALTVMFAVATGGFDRSVVKARLLELYSEDATEGTCFITGSGHGFSVALRPKDGSGMALAVSLQIEGNQIVIRSQSGGILYQGPLQ